MSYSSFKKQHKLFEGFRKFLNEEESQQPAQSQQPAEPQQGSSWPGDAPKNVKITQDSGLTPEKIMATWNELAAMGPPNDAGEVLAQIGGANTLVRNVLALEKNFAAANKNPARIEMPHVKPKQDMKDLKVRLKKGMLDVKPPFAPDGASEPSSEDLPLGLDKHPQGSRNKWLSKGLQDKNKTDDSAVTLGQVSIDVNKAFPTQKQVYLDKSMWNILNFGPLDQGGTIAYNGIAIKDGEKGYILDGHHRWSSAFIAGGPSAKIKVQGLQGLDIATAIAALRSYGNARGNPQKG